MRRLLKPLSLIAISANLVCSATAQQRQEARPVGPQVAQQPEEQRVAELAGTVIPEGVETAIPIEQVANESAVGLALDPLNQPFNSQGFRRPDLYWLFWTSTRAGAPDLYFETIAPRHTPLPRR